jgi:hypothetical protein
VGGNINTLSRKVLFDHKNELRKGKLRGISALSNIVIRTKAQSSTGNRENVQQALLSNYSVNNDRC